MCMSNLQKFPTFNMCSNQFGYQPTNQLTNPKQTKWWKMMANLN